MEKSRLGCWRIGCAGLCVFVATTVGSSRASDEIGRGNVNAGELSSAVPVDFDVKVAYYDDGKVRSRSAFDPKKRLVGRISYYHDGSVQKEERFDAQGRKVEESNFDSNGKLEDNFDGWAAKRWLYKDGALRMESVYGEDGRLTERKIYNDLGDLTERQYVGDGRIDDTEEFNRGSVATKETDTFYDAYGRRTGSSTTAVDDLDDIFPDWLWY